MSTISVYKSADTSLVEYTLADEKGRFKLHRLPAGQPLRMVITHTGFKVVRRQFTLDQTAPGMEMGRIYMIPDTTSLDAVTVTAERPPVIIRNDTIEFNASSFKTWPNAVLEDLLKKLPGVTVAPDGNLYAQGRPVNRILVDGRRFFSNDPQIALKNLPADIVDKVQVTTDKEELRNNPDVDSSQVGKVINLTLKKGIRKGYFGKLYAGHDIQDHYEAGGMVNSFRDTLQVSVLGYGNNVNKAGFSPTDVMNTGGFARNSSKGTTSVYNGGGGYSINGVSLGGTGDGLQQSKGGGFNLNTLFGQHIKLNTLYFYGSVTSDQQQQTRQQQLIGDTTLTTIGQSAKTSTDAFHKLGGNLEWQIDTSLSLVFTPEFNYLTKDGHSNSGSDMSSNTGGLLNHAVYNGQWQGKDWNYTHNLSIAKYFGNPQRTLTINHTLNIAPGRRVEDYFSNNAYYSSDTINQIVTQDQYKERPTRQTNLNTEIHFNDPINTWLSVGWDASHTASFERQSIGTYSEDPGAPWTRSFIDSLSNQIDRHKNRTSTTISTVMKLKKKLSLTIGSNLLWIRIRNNNNKAGTMEQRYYYPTPRASVRWGDWSFNYDVSFTEPSLSDVQTIVNNSNALYQQIGNPDLLPTRQHHVTVNYFKYNFERQMYYSFYGSAAETDHAIVTSRSIDDKGVQLSKPVNVNGIKSFSAGGSINFTTKISSKWKIQWAPSLFGLFSESVSIVNGAQNWTSFLMTDLSPQCTLSYGDFFELNPIYRLSFRKANRMSTTAIPNDVTNQTIQCTARLRPSPRWTLESAMLYKYNPDLSTTADRSMILLNGSVSFLCLKDYRGEIKLLVNDLLNQNANVTRYIYDNYVTERISNSLRRYVMLSFLYNVKHF